MLDWQELFSPIFLVVFDELKQMKRACDSAHLKTILATGELKNNENIYKASFAAMLSGKKHFFILTY
jgi:deoxyribose-phosphate aldolase